MEQAMSESQPPINRIIDQLARTEGVIGGVLIGANGKPISSAGFRNGGDDLLAEQALEIVRVCHVLSLRLGAGDCLDTLIEGPQGKLMAIVLADKVLVAVARKGSPVAPAIHAMHEAARHLRALA
jgi:uncharacterized protein